MAPVDLRALCLGLPGAVEEFPFNDREVSVFKIWRKVFAITKLDAPRLTVSVKCDPDLAFELRSRYEGIEPGYHLNKRHWITIDLESDVGDVLVRELIEDSYDLVRPPGAPARPTAPASPQEGSST